MKPPASVPAAASLAPPAPRTAPPRSLVLALVGSGGDGVALLGDLVLGMAAREGLYGMMVQSYGPQIRGGESAAIVRISESEVLYEGDQVDILLCFRLRDLKRFQGSLRVHSGSVVVIDREEAGDPPEWLGHTNEARQFVVRLQKRMQDARWRVDEEAGMFLYEVELRIHNTPLPWSPGKEPPTAPTEKLTR